MKTRVSKEHRSHRQKAMELVKQMTVSEQVHQTLHRSAAIERLGIPAYNWWNEALHGVARAGLATVFPQAIGLAATFDPDLIFQVADIISTEGRAKYNKQSAYGDRDIYKGLTFWAPNVNIFRDPRWGRGHETFGEDPYLSGRLGVSFVKGIQGDHPKYMKAAACAKHFAVHSGPEDLRHAFDAVVSKQDLYETYLPAFKACVTEGKVEAVMGAYNRTNGEPACGSKTLLQDILRDQWGFEGHVVSDCFAIQDFHLHHHVTQTPIESVAMAMNHGCDLNCGNQFLYLEEAITSGLVSEKRIEEAVTNLYTAKYKLGIVGDSSDNPYTDIPYRLVDCQEHQMMNELVAQKTLVLLKNDHELLPLKVEDYKTIGLIGPNANNRKALVGNYEGTASRYYTLSEGIQSYVGDRARILFSEGCHLYRESFSGMSLPNDRLSEVKSVCDESDIIIACLGLDAGLEGEEGDRGNQFASGDKINLDLPGMQQVLLETLVASGKPVVLVLLSGSALAITWAHDHVPAIVQGWYPGALGGKAIASTLFGECSPEGKLPITFYKTTEELPDIKDYAMVGRTYRYMTQEALYPFGYGLSYSRFKIKDVVYEDLDLSAHEHINIELDMHNLGPFDGSETIQVYIRAVRPGGMNPQLKHFQKVYLEVGETRRLRLTLKREAFGLYNDKGQVVLHSGAYQVFIGTSQPDRRSEALTGEKPFSFGIQVKNNLLLA